MNKIKTFILTFVQYVLLIYFLIFCKWFSSNILLLSIQIIGISIATWAIIVMQKSRLNIAPNPLRGAVLIKSGPYKIIRHPMYLSLILALTPIILSDCNVFNISLFAIFIINLLLKMFYEEKLLKKHFMNYNEYMKKTWRLIPYIF